MGFLDNYDILMLGMEISSFPCESRILPFQYLPSSSWFDGASYALSRGAYLSIQMSRSETKLIWSEEEA